jgi:hypothetical protein
MNLLTRLLPRCGIRRGKRRLLQLNHETRRKIRRRIGHGAGFENRPRSF